MMMFVEYMRQRGSRQAKNAGRQLKAATIGAYESAIRTFPSREAGQVVVSAGAAALLPLAMKQMRGEDGPPGSRKLSRALRAAHFALLAAAVTAARRATSSSGRRRWLRKTCCCGGGDWEAAGERIRRVERYHLGIHPVDGCLGG
eukprot:5130840-Pleurochrysis_carterae.AAC.1